MTVIDQSHVGTLVRFNDERDCDFLFRQFHRHQILKGFIKHKHTDVKTIQTDRLL